MLFMGGTVAPPLLSPGMKERESRSSHKSGSRRGAGTYGGASGQTVKLGTSIRSLPSFELLRPDPQVE